MIIKDQKDLLNIANGFKASRILLTAFELDIFTVIADQNLPSVEIAEKITGDPRATDRLLNALSALGLLVKREGLFSNTELSLNYLVKGGDNYLAGLNHTSHLYSSWATLTDAARAGGTVRDYSAIFEDQSAREAFIAAMHRRARETAPQIIAHLNLEGVTRLLDVGGGSGVFSIAFLRENPKLRAVVFDLPPVIELTQKYTAEAGFSESISVTGGDYKSDPLPGGFDLVFLSAIIHSNTPEENSELVKKSFQALNRGGRIAIHDFIMDDDRTGPLFGALFAINMLVNTPGGDTYTAGEVSAWLENAGFSAITRIDTGNAGSFITGEKKAG